MCTSLHSTPEENAPWGYKPTELVSQDQLRVGLGSLNLVGYGREEDIYLVREIRAGESLLPNLAVLVLRNAINPTLPNIRPAMLFLFEMPGEASIDVAHQMRTDEIFTSVGWGYYAGQDRNGTCNKSLSVTFVSPAWSKYACLIIG